MNSDRLLTIGELAKKCNITIYRLRNYDKADILKPHYVDPDNCRRYYSLDQIHIVEGIKTLRDLDFSLQEIHRILTKNDLKTLANIHHSKSEKITLQISKLESIKKRLEQKIINYKNIDESIVSTATNTTNNVKIMHIEKRPIIYVSGNRIISEQSLILYHNELNSFLEKSHFDTVAPCMVLYHDDYFKSISEESRVDVGRKVFSEIKEEHENVKYIPDGEYASLIFRGGRKASEENYKYLSNWLKENNYIADGPLIKLYHVNTFQTKNHNNCISEFQIKIK